MYHSTLECPEATASAHPVATRKGTLCLCLTRTFVLATSFQSDFSTLEMRGWGESFGALHFVALRWDGKGKGSELLMVLLPGKGLSYERDPR